MNCIYGIKKARFGIRMSYADGVEHEISFNPVSGTADDFSARAAIYLEEAKNVTVCSNTVDWTEEGLKFTGDCDNATISANVIQHHQYGLLVGSPDPGSPVSGILGVQDRRGNSWLAEYNYPEWAAFHNGNDNEILLSRFFVESMDPSILPPQRFPSTGLWFEFTGGEKNYCIEEEMAGGNMTTPKENLIVLSNDPNVVGATSAEFWDMRRQLSRRGRENAFLASEMGQELGFFHPANTVGHSRAGTVDADFRGLAALSQVFNDDFAAIRQNQKYALEQLMTLNGARNQTETEDVDEVLLAAKAVHWATLKEALEEEQSIQVNLSQQYQTALAAIALNPVLQESAGYHTNYESAYRLLQQYKIKRLLGTDTDTELLQVQALATEDPATFGLAAIGARIYAPLCEQLSEEIQATAEETSGILPDVLLTPAERLLFEVYPNPATHTATIALETDAQGIIQLLNIQGEFVLAQSLKNASTVELNLQGLASGIYVLRYLGNDGTVQQRKLIVE